MFHSCIFCCILGADADSLWYIWSVLQGWPSKVLSSTQWADISDQRATSLWTLICSSNWRRCLSFDLSVPLLSLLSLLSFLSFPCLLLFSFFSALSPPAPLLSQSPVIPSFSKHHVLVQHFFLSYPLKVSTCTSCMSVRLSQARSRCTLYFQIPLLLTVFIKVRSIITLLHTLYFLTVPSLLLHHAPPSSPLLLSVFFSIPLLFLFFFQHLASSQHPFVPSPHVVLCFTTAPDRFCSSFQHLVVRMRLFFLFHLRSLLASGQSNVYWVLLQYDRKSWHWRIKMQRSYECLAATSHLLYVITAFFMHLSPHTNPWSFFFMHPSSHTLTLNLFYASLLSHSHPLCIRSITLTLEIIYTVLLFWLHLWRWKRKERQHEKILTLCGSSEECPFSFTLLYFSQLGLDLTYLNRELFHVNLRLISTQESTL